MRLKYGTTDELIAANLDAMRAKPGDKIISTPGRTMRVHTDGEKIIHLPNGVRLKVTTDASDHATHIEEDDRLHAIARPDTLRLRLRPDRPQAGSSSAASPEPVRVRPRIHTPGGPT